MRSPPIKRACLGAVGFALAVSWGCVAERPEGAPVSDASAGDIAAAMVDQGVVVCKLVGRDSIVEVRAAEGGTRYTLRDEAGTLVAANLDADALARIRPDLDPRSMQADEPVMGPLMLIDTDR